MENLKANPYKLCVFCCKPADNQLEATEKDKKLRYFLTQLENYLRKKIDFPAEIFELSTVCSTCEFLISSFCNIYHEIRCLELKANWKVENLMCVIKQANQVASRIKLAQDMCGNETGNYKQLMMTRKKLANECMAGGRVAFPLVLVEKIEVEPQSAPREADRFTMTENTKLESLVLPKVEPESTQANEGDNGSSESSYSDDLENGSLFEADDVNPTITETDLNKVLPVPDINLISAETDIMLENYKSSKEKIAPENQFKCKQCNKTFHRRAGLTLHFRHIHHQPKHKKQSFYCKLCDKEFQTYKKYSRHMRTLLHLPRLTFKKNSENTTKKEVSEITSPTTSQAGAETHSVIEDVNKQDKQDRRYTLRTKPKLSLKYRESAGDSSSETSATSTDDEIPVIVARKRVRSRQVNGEINGKQCAHKNCYFWLQTPEEVQAHEQLHKTGSHKCKFCDETLSNIIELSIHEQKLHCLKKYKASRLSYCPRCPYASISMTGFITHFAQVHAGIQTLSMAKCQVCKIDIMSKNVDKHFASFHDISKIAPENAIKCNVTDCTAYFITKNSWLTHKHVVHRNYVDPKNKCSKCHKMFRNPELLAIHMRMLHGKKPKHLSIQLQTIAENEKGMVHPGNAEELGTFVCQLPNCRNKTTFVTISELQNHQKLHGNFQCKFCNVTQSYATDLANHEQEHVQSGSEDGDKKVYKCSRCSDKRVSHVHFERHFLKVHLGLESSTICCNLCQKRYATMIQLMKHTKAIHGPISKNEKSTFKCNKCQAYFAKKSSLLLHKRHNHEVDKSKLECLKCEKTFKSMGSARSHLRLFHKFCNNSNENEFQCTIKDCGKKFKTFEELEWHEVNSIAPFHSRYSKNLIHYRESNLTKVTCEKCGKECTGEGGLRAHMVTHRENRPTQFKCDLCEKVFKQKIHLQRHQEFHKDPNEWKFMCSVCSKKCATKYLLQTHMQTHSQEKPFVCQICGVKYAHRHNLRNHVNSKHKDEGVEDIPRVYDQINFVSRKGKKLEKGFCLISAQNQMEKL